MGEITCMHNQAMYVQAASVAWMTKIYCAPVFFRSLGEEEDLANMDTSQPGEDDRPRAR